jgi:DNA-binding response OmpR family regulator
LKILVIEDEQSLRENITSYLNVDGNICESADSLSSAIEKLSIYQYDSVLLDIGLPDGDGFTILDYLCKELTR